MSSNPKKPINKNKKKKKNKQQGICKEQTITQLFKYKCYICITPKKESEICRGRIMFFSLNKTQPHRWIEVPFDQMNG